jgi:hypothetical protein
MFGPANKVQFHFNASFTKLCRQKSYTCPLGMSVVANNSIQNNMQKFQKGSAFHKLRSFTMFLEYLQMKQASKKFGPVPINVQNVKLNAFLYSIYIQKYIKLPKLYVGAILIQFEPVLRMLPVQGHFETV